jgi:T-complex protein 1 subunit delta
VVPYTLAQNAGLNALVTVTELRNRHASGESNAGINVRRVCTAPHYVLRFCRAA